MRPGAEASEQRDELVGRPRDYRPPRADHDRTLHQLGIFEQQRDHLVGRSVVGRLESELGEALVLADQIGWRRVNDCGNPLERGAGRRSLEIFDGVELDTAALE
jgi:hypothetical protein